jgi:hypothetical protein
VFRAEDDPIEDWIAPLRDIAKSVTQVKKVMKMIPMMPVLLYTMK